MTRAEYLLTCLGEEGNEIAQRVCKAIRFGILEVEPGHELTNMQRLKGEYADMLAVMEILQEEAIVSRWAAGELSDLIRAKREKIEHYLAYSRSLGIVEA